MAEVRKVFQQERKREWLPDGNVQKALVREVETGVINDPILKACNLDLSGEPFKLYTITSMFIRACTVYLDTKEFLDIGGLITMERDVRVNDDAEKSGNIVAKIKPGEILKSIVNRTQVELGILDIAMGSEIIRVPVRKDFNEQDRITLGFIQTQTAKLLNGYKYGINPEDWTIYIIAFLFIKHAVLVAMRNATGNTAHRCKINFADTIDITVSCDPKKDTFKIKCDPSKESKLNVKSDSYTEK